MAKFLALQNGLVTEMIISLPNFVLFTDGSDDVGVNPTSVMWVQRINATRSRLHMNGVSNPAVDGSVTDVVNALNAALNA